MSVRTINPASEEILAEYELDSRSEIEEAIGESYEAFSHWRKLKLDSRLACVETFERGLQSARHSLAEIMTKEMGKPVKESLAEVDKCVASCRTLRENYPRWREERSSKLGNGYHVTHEPLGVVLGIMPWNFPLWQVVRFAIPTLLGGNAILLKHAPNTWGSAELIASIFQQALPHRLYINLKIDIPTVEPILADRRVAGVSLTGSKHAGMKIGALAGTYLKRAVLELGGSDAYLILDDADLEAAAKLCVTSRLINTGQSCVAAKRFIVTRKNVEPFTKLMRDLLAAKSFGDPLLSGTDLGPLARKDLRLGLHQQVERSLVGGAKLVIGGILPEGKGYFYPPTLLTQVQPGIAAFDEELFGPVAAVIAARDETEAIALANTSHYGLGAAIFSRDVERARQIARDEVEAGMVCINDYVRSDALVPFGGVKDSGLGRELGREGCFEFTNVKSIFTN